MDYRVIYVGAQAVFGILFLTLLFLRHVNYQGRRFDKLDAVYVLFIITVVLDSIWMLINGRAEYRSWHVALHVAYLCTMSLTGYLWFLYTLDYFPAKKLPIRKYRFVLGIPVLVIMALVVASVKTSWMFVVDEGGLYIRGDLHIYLILMNYSFMLLGSYVALRCRKETLLTSDKRRYAVAALFPVPVLLLSVAQMVLPPGLPAMQGGVLVSLLLLFGTFQNSMVTRDHLTGLPNRFAFEQDLLERMHRWRPGDGNRLYLMEGDLDDFKRINDTFGHPAGDRALQVASQVLGQVFTPKGAVVFRTGGDEFMIVAETEGPLDVAAVGRELNDALTHADAPEGMHLGMSLGAQEYDGQMDFRTLIEEVDKRLYAAKRS